MPVDIPSAITVALVEDEPVLREEIAFQLRHLGFTVETFEEAATFYRYLAVHPTHVIAVLDIGLNGEDGISICHYLREHDSQMGIVFATARGLRNDRICGLLAGADAYLVKPIDMEELALVLQRLASRYLDFFASHAHEPRSGDSEGWRLSTDCSYLTTPNEVQVKLTLTESQLLQMLLNMPGKVCHYVELGVAIHLEPGETIKHRVAVIINRLRGKVERETGLSLPLRSYRCIGYSFSCGGGGNRLE